MDVKFIVNDYILVWNLLFQPSVSENIHKIKQKLWVNYKNEYNEMYYEKNEILSDYKNFIPNNDLLYNIVFDIKEYKSLLKISEKYKLELIKLWDKNKKEVNNILKDDLRIELGSYNIFCLFKELNQFVISDNNIMLGKAVLEKHDFITNSIFQILKYQYKDYNKEYPEIVEAILELAILNEFKSLFTDNNCYLQGDATLNYLKKKIYPYWLMYLGIDETLRDAKMNSDKIIFDPSHFPYEKKIANLELSEFIDFCIRNQKKIINLNKIEVI